MNVTETDSGVSAIIQCAKEAVRTARKVFQAECEQCHDTRDFGHLRYDAELGIWICVDCALGEVSA